MQLPRAVTCNPPIQPPMLMMTLLQCILISVPQSPGLDDKFPLLMVEVCLDLGVQGVCHAPHHTYREILALAQI